MEKVQERAKAEPIETFKKALTNATPLIEVKARRIGGSTYQVPIDVKPEWSTPVKCWQPLNTYPLSVPVKAGKVLESIAKVKVEMFGRETIVDLAYAQLRKIQD